MEGTGEPTSVAAGATCCRPGGSKATVNSGSQRWFRSTDFEADCRARTRYVRAGIQEYPGGFPQEGSGRAITSNHEPGIQPRAGRELQALSCGGRLLERRQASQALRSRYGANAL